jgi:hypothetical protein
MKYQNISQTKQKKISNEEILFQFREGVKEAIVDLFLFEPDMMNNFFQKKLEN